MSASQQDVSTNAQVDSAFERCFGYKWSDRPAARGGAPLLPQTNDGSRKRKMILHEQLTELFGSRQIATRILQLYDVSTKSNNNCNNNVDIADNALSVLNRMTKRIKEDSVPSSFVSSIKSNLSTSTLTYKKPSISPEEYMHLPLPASVAQAKHQQVEQESVLVQDSTGAKTKEIIAAATSKASTTGSAPASDKNSNLDNVLKQLAGPKKINTVEKTSGDWENFKGTDKQLQDELERTAQSKDAFLVKQDFLERVDQRRFELERDERDQERARRQLASASSSQK